MLKLACLQVDSRGSHHRVVTLSREVHAGLLSRDIEEDNSELESLDIPKFDLVCVDLYPLQAEIAREGSTRESVIEKTDIGGPTLIRSAVKGARIVVCDPEDRDSVINWIEGGEPENGFREELAAKGEFIVAQYCMASANYLSGGEFIGMSGRRTETCKYGENGWQKPAYLYSTGSKDPLALDTFQLIDGTAPSSNNWVDIDRLLQTCTHIGAARKRNGCGDGYIAVGVKHGNPCGAGVSPVPRTALEYMMGGDPLAIFGGLVMVNFEIDEDNADVLAGKMLDGIVAPHVTPGALEILRRKGNKCRFLVNPALADLSDKLDLQLRFRYVRGGFITQPNYTYVPVLSSDEIWKHGEARVVKENDMLLAWAIGSTSNSNTITIVHRGQLLGNGVGQQDRVGAAKLAVDRAVRSGHTERLEGAVVYSDSFFPFPDGPQILIDAGIKAIFTTWGSMRDGETITLCKKHNVALYMARDDLGRGFYNH